MDCANYDKSISKVIYLSIDNQFTSPGIHKAKPKNLATEQGGIKRMDNERDSALIGILIVNAIANPVR